MEDAATIILSAKQALQSVLGWGGGGGGDKYNFPELLVSLDERCLKKKIEAA
jgi:hypothetical protein